ncbi:MAG: FecR domain-containing protein, partial [Pseudomonadota bacterium]
MSQPRNDDERGDLAAQRRIDDEANSWLLLLTSGVASGEERQRFVKWLDADPRHRETFDELCIAWQAADALRDAFTAPETQALNTHQGPDRARPAGRPRRRLGTSTPWRTRGTIFLTLIFLAAAVLTAPRVTTFLAADHRTAVGEQSRVALPDGSDVWLNTDTAIAVDFDDTRRRISLLRGEAHFVVVPSSERPFDVYASGGRIRVTGTAFTASTSGSTVSVSVEKGSVSVLSPAPREGTSAAGSNALLKGGHGVRYARGARPG